MRGLGRISWACSSAFNTSCCRQAWPAVSQHSTAVDPMLGPVNEHAPSCSGRRTLSSSATPSAPYPSRPSQDSAAGTSSTSGSSGSSGGGGAVQRAEDAPKTLLYTTVEPLSAEEQRRRPRLTLDGSRIADPGEARYLAPVWIPPEDRKELRLPLIMYSDPWFNRDDWATRQRHVQLCFEELELEAQNVSEAMLTAREIMHRVNARVGRTFANLRYVMTMLEHQRKGRMLLGHKNPASKLSHGHPDHPRFYTLNKYQKAKTGSDQWNAEREKELRRQWALKGTKRVRNGKPPRRIHRTQAFFSLVQHELGQEQIRLAIQRLKEGQPAEAETFAGLRIEA